MSRNHQQSDEVIEDDLPWLLPLLTDRVLDIRWCGWSLSTALFDGIAGAKSVVNEFQVFPGGVWASAVAVILDDFENPLVRTQVLYPTPIFMAFSFDYILDNFRHPLVRAQIFLLYSSFLWLLRLLTRVRLING